MEEQKKLTIKERWKKAATADNIVDFSVDVFLIVFDVLSSPILIVMRVIRWLLNKFVNKHIKGFIKRKLKSGDWYLSSHEAVYYGFADNVITHRSYGSISSLK